MRKFIATITAAFIALFALVAFGSAASAHDQDKPSPDNDKKVTFCHATGVDGKYNKITTSIFVFYQAGHIDHAPGGNLDIYPEVSWTDHHGNVHTVPAQGDQSLLAFDDCEQPPTDTEIDAPEPTHNDPCGTDDDTLSVPAGTGYTVGNVVKNGLTWSITVTANDGFVFKAPGDPKTRTFSHTFTDVACDLPETGGVERNVAMGIGAGLLFAAVGGYLLLSSRRRTRA